MTPRQRFTLIFVLDVPLRLDAPLRSRYIVTRCIVAVVVAFTFIGIALVIIARAPPGDSRATIFYALALLSAITMTGNMASIVEQSNARGIDANSLPFKPSTVIFGSIAFLYPPLILHLALVFPRRLPILERT